MEKEWRNDFGYLDGLATLSAAVHPVNLAIDGYSQGSYYEVEFNSFLTGKRQPLNFTVIQS